MIQRTRRSPSSLIASTLLFALLAFLFPLMGIMPAAATTPHAAVLLYGDSIAYQDGPSLTQALATNGVDVHAETFPGTALCDWINRVPTDLATYRPKVLVLQFVAYADSGCLAANGKGGSQGWVQLTHAVYAAVIKEALANGVSLVEIVPAPPRSFVSHHDPSMRTEHLFHQVFSSLVKSLHDPHVIVDEAGLAVASPKGGWTRTLPCLPVERSTPGHCTGPTRHGVRTNVVRSPTDSFHFCVVNFTFIPLTPPGCPTLINGHWVQRYSSGAFRMAQAIATPIRIHLGIRPSNPDRVPYAVISTGTAWRHASR